MIYWALEMSREILPKILVQKSPLADTHLSARSLCRPSNPPVPLAGLTFKCLFFLRYHYVVVFSQRQAAHPRLHSLPITMGRLDVPSDYNHAGMTLAKNEGRRDRTENCSVSA